jgi:glycerophosphoryl diester phosphodiesterase
LLRDKGDRFHQVAAPATAQQNVLCEGVGGSDLNHPLVNRTPEIIAHRGANREAAENTIAAFGRALELGADGVELDVHLSADGVPVVHHDFLLRDGHRIAELTRTDLRAAGAVPTLQEVLEFIDARCRLYVEIKAAAAVDEACALLSPRREWCAIHSFDHRIALRAHERVPEIETGILLVSYLVDSVGALRAAGARDLWQQADFVDEGLVKNVHGAGGRVIAWTVNDVGRARDLRAIGVDGICTDVPAVIREGLRDTP